MNRNNRMKWVIVALVFVPAIFGCTPGVQNVLVQKPPVLSPTPLPMATIDKRIGYLRTVAENENESAEQRELASLLLETYQKIRNASLENTGQYNYNEIIASLFKSLNRLEEQYFSEENTGMKKETKVVHRLTLERKKIMNLYLDGDYQGVINSCLELEAAYGLDALTPEIGLLLAISLAKSGHLEEAVNVGNGIMRDLEGKPDLMQLIAEVIDWQLDLGRQEKASQAFKKLMDQMQEREALFKRAERRVINNEGEKGRIQNPSPKVSGTGSGFVLPDTIEAVLKEVDRMVQNHDFQGAKMLLVRQRLKIQEGPEIETIDETLEAVDLAEENYQKEKNIKAIQKEETLVLARKLIDEDKLEQAITRLEELEKNQDTTSEETSNLKNMAIEKFINQERTKAAKLFLMAGNTSDPKKKETLLVSSYNILKALADNYPLSPLNQKINDHIHKILDALDKLRKETD